MRTLLIILLLTGFGSTALAQSSWSDTLRGVLEQDEDRQEDKAADRESAPEPGNLDMTQALRQALNAGVHRAVQTLGTEGGFLTDDQVRINLPSGLEPLADAARRVGQDRYVDELETTLNRAAERAIPATADILISAVLAMNVDDAAAILKGNDDAASQYFRRTTGDALHAAILPLVQEATDQTGVTQAYKALQNRGGGMLSLLMGDEDADLDAYVTQKAMDGLFYYIAEQERAIRTDPVARTTDLLAAVFGR